MFIDITNYVAITNYFMLKGIASQPMHLHLKYCTCILQCKAFTCNYSFIGIKLNLHAGNSHMQGIG